MSVPMVYTEASLIAFMTTVLGPTGDALPETIRDAVYQEALIETLLSYGVGDIVNATDVQKLRALARVAIWQAVVDATAGRYDISADGQSLSRSQLHQQARQSLRAAKQTAARYDDAYAVVMASARYTSDPYLTIEEA